MQQHFKQKKKRKIKGINEYSFIQHTIKKTIAILMYTKLLIKEDMNKILTDVCSSESINN